MRVCRQRLLISLAQISGRGEKDDWRTMLEKKESPANLNNGVTPAGRVETVV